MELNFKKKLYTIDTSTLEWWC